MADRSRRARSRCTENPDRQSAPSGLQEAGVRSIGRDVRQQERHGILRGESVVRLQHRRIVHRTLEDGAQKKRHGEALAIEQSVQSTRAVLSHSGGSHDGLRHRSTSVAGTVEVVPEVVLDDELQVTATTGSSATREAGQKDQNPPSERFTASQLS